MKSNCRNGIFVTDAVDELHALMFADDVTTVADTVANLQDHINRISEFSEITGIELNLDKSKVMVFRNGGPLRDNEIWFYRGKRIEVVSQYKYLGSFFTPKLAWTKTKQTLSMQATKAIGVILKYQRHFGYFHHNEAFKLFDAIIKPILLYSSEIWGFCIPSKEIERVHINFCKRLCGLNQSVTNFMALSECGRYPLHVFYIERCIKYWTKLITMPNFRYPGQCYKMLKNLDDMGRFTWATHIKTILYQYGFGYVWIAEEIGDINRFMSEFKKRLKDCARQSILEDIGTSPKSTSYKLFKSTLEPESYLSLPLNYYLKRTLSNFRCSSHSLMIEKGRHLNIERDYRFCKYCLSRDIYTVETEIHFLLICPMYDQLRKQYFKTEWLNMIHNERTFVHIMSARSQQSVFSLARFIQKGLCLQQEFTDAWNQSI
jgi:hypothetical protein